MFNPRRLPAPNTADRARAALRPTLLAAAAAALALGSSHAWAQGTDATRASSADSAIPAQPLTQALATFARRAGLQLVYAPDLVQGLRSTALPRHIDVSSSLSTLLRGTGLKARQVGETWVIERDTTESLPLVRTSAGDSETATDPQPGYVARRSAIGGKIDTPVREIPQSISVATRDSMDARGATNVAQALEYAPGFTAITFGHDDRYDWSIARGLGTTYSSNFRDGLKDVGGLYAVAKLNNYGVERVEFVRGPASLLFGSNTPGGAVNSITKRPTAAAQNEIRLRAGDDSRRGFGVDVAGPLNDSGTLLYRVVASHENFGLTTPSAEKEERYFAPAITLKISADTELTLLANYQQDLIDGDAYPFSYTETLGRYVLAEEEGWDRFYRDQWSAGVLLKHRFNDALSFHSATRYGRVDLDYKRTSATAFVSSTVVARSAQHLQDTATSWQTDNYLQGTWTAGRWANTTIAGMDVLKLDGSLYRGIATVSNYDTVAQKGLGSFAAPALSPMYLSEKRQTGVYVQNQAKFEDQFVVLAGLRHDRFRESILGGWVGGPVQQSKVTGRIGAVWLLPAGVSPYASYASSFEPRSGATFNGTPFKPTAGRQYEVGVRYEPAGTNAMVSAAVFDIAQQNVLAADPLNKDYSVQRGEISPRGFEFEANLSLGNGLDLTGSYTYTDAKVSKDTTPALIGRKNGLVPVHKAAVWVDYRMPAGVKAGLGVRYNSDVPDHPNTRWVPGVTLVDARLGYQVNASWQLSLNARNLLDKQHLVNCSYGSCYPGEPRRLTATADYRW